MDANILRQLQFRSSDSTSLTSPVQKDLSIEELDANLNVWGGRSNEPEASSSRRVVNNLDEPGPYTRRDEPGPSCRRVVNELRNRQSGSDRRTEDRGGSVSQPGASGQRARRVISLPENLRNLNENTGI